MYSCVWPLARRFHVSRVLPSSRHSARGVSADSAWYQSLPPALSSSLPAPVPVPIPIREPCHGPRHRPRLCSQLGFGPVAQPREPGGNVVLRGASATPAGCGKSYPRTLRRPLGEVCTFRVQGYDLRVFGRVAQSLARPGVGWGAGSRTACDINRVSQRSASENWQAHYLMHYSLHWEMITFALYVVLLMEVLMASRRSFGS